MKRNDNRNSRHERFVMYSTSALVLTALTLSGVYMRNHSQRALDNGYTIDFSALEDRADNKLREIAKGAQNEQEELKIREEITTEFSTEAGSDEIRIPGLTDRRSTDADQSSGKGMSGGEGSGLAGKKTEYHTGKENEKITEKPAGKTEEPTADIRKAESVSADEILLEDELTDDEAMELIVETAGESPVVTEDLHFSADSMIKPVSGEPIIDYSMDGSVYFATLDQYKYNPAVIYSAEQGEAVSACNLGRVINIHDDAELGHVLVLDLGDGYQAIYGQLENIEVPIGGTVDPGMKLACVAQPTRYYSKEGANLYFQIRKDGTSIDPGSFFQE